jgi:hypothetical protein
VSDVRKLPQRSMRLRNFLGVERQRVDVAKVSWADGMAPVAGASEQAQPSSVTTAACRVPVQNVADV